MSLGPADVLVVFAAERSEKLEYGFALTFGRCAMVLHPAAGRSDTVMSGWPSFRAEDGPASR